MTLFGELAEFEKGKDELNIAEYPLSLAGKTLTSRKNGDGSLVTYTDHIRDKSTGSVVERKVTISAPTDLGLPTYYDEEVLFGILQLTHHRRRQDKSGSWPKSVTFTRYELSRLLGLKHGGSGYRRLKDSIERITGTTYRFKYAWFDNEHKVWRNGVSINFIQDVQWDESPTGKDGRVTITWNDNIHRNFEAGYLRDINYLEYRAMELPLAKALYRFLGKHFYRRKNLSFDLHNLAYEKLGLSRKYDTGQIKRALAPALKRLEDRGYIVALPPKQRYEKITKGVWKIHLHLADRAKKPQQTLDEAVPTGLELQLVEAGVSRSVATQLVADNKPELIIRKLDVMKWLAERGEKPNINPGAWLAKSIREDWAEPEAYESLAQRERKRIEKEKKKLARETKELAHREAMAVYQKASDERAKLVTAYWESLPEDERQAIEDEAIGKGKGASFRKLRPQIFIDLLLGERLEAEGEIPKLPPNPDHENGRRG